MSFNEFVEWCNKCARDGCWTWKAAVYCESAIAEVRKAPFWKRERRWKEMNKINPFINELVNFLNRKIEERQAMRANDLISRSALIAEYDRAHIGPPGGARKLMEDAPAIDPEELRPKGLWVMKDNRGNGVCSHCNRQDRIDPLATHCRYCGAKMEVT